MTQVIGEKRENSGAPLWLVPEHGEPCHFMRRLPIYGPGSEFRIWTIPTSGVVAFIPAMSKVFSCIPCVKLEERTSISRLHVLSWMATTKRKLYHLIVIFTYMYVYRLISLRIKSIHQIKNSMWVYMTWSVSLVNQRCARSTNQAMKPLHLWIWILRRWWLRSS